MSEYREALQGIAEGLWEMVAYAHSEHDVTTCTCDECTTHRLCMNLNMPCDCSQCTDDGGINEL